MTRTLLAALIATLMAGAAQASEDFTLRYAPGIGGADMSAPLEGGWVIQTPVFSYRAHIDHGQVVSTPLQPLGAPIPSTATTQINTRINVGVDAVLPRLTWMGQGKFLGAQVGFTAMLPLMRQKAAVSVQSVATTVSPAGVGLEGVGALVNAGATASAKALALANSNAATGAGDLELAPVLRWSTENSQWLFVPAVILPTGKYDGRHTANPGAGEYLSFRPLVQYSYIGDGWDLGTRASFAINGTNAKTHFRTGNYLNLDTALLKSLSDAWRVGVAGYAVVQTTPDKITVTPTDPALAARLGVTNGLKGRVFGLGPELAYIKGAGDYELDGRLVREFGAQDRPQGTAFWINLSLPL